MVHVATNLHSKSFTSSHDEKGVCSWPAVATFLFATSMRFAAAAIPTGAFMYLCPMATYID